MSNKPDAVPQNLVDELRTQFLSEVDDKGVDAVHPKDLERVKTDDFWLKRFIAHNENNIPQALKMMWTSLTWRKEFQVNDINENTVNVEILKHGGLFPYGKDIDGKTLFIVKGNKHVKGVFDPLEIKRCVIYWFERLEKQTKGDTITLFFDMDGSGLKNTDMDFMKFLIGLFKEYYPFFLNYILILEMPWVLNAAFKVIKSWLPEKAVEKIKFLSKKDITNFVPAEEALKCWGGENHYEFKFISEQDQNQNKDGKKVHFSESTMINESSNNYVNQKKEDGPLRVNPSGILSFAEQGTETLSTVELTNTDPANAVTFKLKTTSPEKFRVKPSTGVLQPNASVKVTVTLLPGFQLGGLAKEKFLVMSTAIEQNQDPLDLSEFWKSTGDKKVFQQRLKCVQNEDTSSPKPVAPALNNEALVKLERSLRKIEANQHELRHSMNTSQRLLTALLVWSVFITIAIFYGFYYKHIDNFEHNAYCPGPEGNM